MLQKALALLQPLLLPLMKPLLKETFDNVVVPQIHALCEQIPNSDAKALCEKIQADLDAFIDKELS